jgi:hypothetical protein
MMIPNMSASSSYESNSQHRASPTGEYLPNIPWQKLPQWVGFASPCLHGAHSNEP